jgi:hypothetical protein
MEAFEKYFVESLPSYKEKLTPPIAKNYERKSDQNQIIM